jgi:hypothetical protein
MTYAELVASVPDWMYAKNRSLADKMPEIVSVAQDELFDIIAHDFFRTKIVGLTIPTSGTLDLSVQQPPVMEIRAIRLKYRKDDEWTPLFRRDLEALSMLYARNVPGRPRYYAEAAGPLMLQVYPTPDQAYTIEVTCNQECPKIGPTVAQNLLTDRAERALKFAILRFAAIYMKDAASEASYTKEMTSAVNALNAAYGRRLRDDTAERPRDTTNATGS